MKIENKIQNGDYLIELLSDEKATQDWEKYLIGEIQKTVRKMLTEFLPFYLKYGQHRDEPIRFLATLELGHISELNDIDNETND